MNRFTSSRCFRSLGRQGLGTLEWRSQNWLASSQGKSARDLAGAGDYEP